MNGLKGPRVDAVCNPNTKDAKQPGVLMPILCGSTSVARCPVCVCPARTLSWVIRLFLLVQREEKQLEASLDALLSQVADLKNSLGSFIYKLENEYDRLTW